MDNPILYHFTTEKYDPKNNQSPLILKDRNGRWIGSLSISNQTPDIFKLLHTCYEAGIEEGKEEME